MATSTENDEGKQKTDETINDDAKEMVEEKPSETENTLDESKVQTKSTQELSDEIKSQVEFYFGNVNLQRDKFLAEQRKLDDGWIPMSIMLKFKLLSSLSTDVDVILKALETSDLIEISEDRKKIRRSLDHPLPTFDENYRKEQEARTVYLKGFPQKGITIEHLKSFFSQYEPFENIIMRKFLNKNKQYEFKGSIFVQFNTLENAKKFMEREAIKYGNVELIRKWSEEHSKEKEAEKVDRKQKKKDKASKAEEDKETNESEKEQEINLPKGTILYLEGMDPTVTREIIKEHLAPFNVTAAFVDFRKGDTSGYVRLQGEDTGKIVIDKLTEGKLKLNDELVSCRVLEGDEEEKYLTQTVKMIKDLRKMNRKTGRKKGRHLQKNSRKRHGSVSNNDRPAKKISVE
ncbi:la protein homolog [Prorops nasuta]|uniref:la protein homolog n=1 Tax=Prorops nasuta TaxID=863751 RepID=UPI0034CF03D3